MKKIIIPKLLCFTFIFFNLILVESKAQEILRVAHSSSFSTNNSLDTTYSANEVVNVVQTIMKTYVLPQNIIIKSSDGVENALASTIDNQRYILYNSSFLANFKKEDKAKWAVYFVMAHEIGHHLCGHNLSDSIKSKKHELEADKFAGGFLYKMGASLDEAEYAVKNNAPVKATQTHPSKSQRIEAITQGWQQMQETSPEIINTENPSIRSKNVKSPAIDANYVRVEKDTFLMGKAKVAQVTLNKNFYLSKYEVTFEDFNKFLKDSSTIASDFEPQGEIGTPVRNISWLDAVKYCNWLSKKEGLDTAYSLNANVVERIPNAKGYRLPTEAEWEYAARGGINHDSTLYAGSNEYAKVAVINKTLGWKAEKVGKYKANSLGLHDMSGNVWEWVEDCWSNTLSTAVSNGDAYSSIKCSEKVIRGGSFNLGYEYSTVFARSKSKLSMRDKDFGFRVAKTE